MEILDGALHELQRIIRLRLSEHMRIEITSGSERYLNEDSKATYTFAGFNLTAVEYYTLLLALAPHIAPNFIEATIQEFFPKGGDFVEFGGIKTGNYRGMLPTGETALFILAGNNIGERLRIQNIFAEDHFFYRQRILWIEDVREGEPKMSGRIVVSEEWLDKLLLGKISKPRFSPNFPAKLIETKMQWEDVVLHPQTFHQIGMVATWLMYNSELMNDANISRRIKPGYRVLFHGPSGTGKTLTASLLGKEFQKDVYRIDLSQVVSKYIGETEKNLERIFAKAEYKDWILFFDEADALFGKRTNVQSSHDRYANQEVSYLLQRIEDFSGLIILASNFKNNIDSAFLRRFNQIIHFPMPGERERLMLWENSLPASLKLHPETSLQHFAQKYEISGAAILNVVQYASLEAIKRKDYLLKAGDISEAIHRELHKEGKTV